jgi:hypothetical protein
MKIFVLIFCLLTAGILNATNYDESIDGEISSNPFSPTAWTLDVGSNVITASVVAGDLDYFTITIGPNEFLSNINLTAYPIVDISFIALQAGSVFTEPPNGTNVNNLLGWYHLGPPLNDILPILGNAPGAIGFTPPLGPGTYTFWYQQTGFTTTTATMDFVVGFTPPIPTMSQWALVILAIVVLNLGVVGVYNVGQVRVY